MKNLNFSVSILEHLDWASTKPFKESVGKTKPLYESLHIVNIFDDAIEVIGSYISKLYETKRLEDISSNGDKTIRTSYWFIPSSSKLVKSKNEVKNGINLLVVFRQEEDDSRIMVAENQSSYPSNLVISVYPRSIVSIFSRGFDQFKKASDRKTYIKTTLKHEFKHLRTIWAKANIDVLSIKKYANNVRMNSYEKKEAIKGYNIFDTDTLLYFLNPEESLAFINGIYYKIQNASDEEILNKLISIKKNGNYSRYDKVLKLIDEFDNDYYFSQIKNIIEKLKNPKSIKDGYKRYEIYNFLIHAKELGIFKEIKDLSHGAISYEDFKKIPYDEQITMYDGTIRVIEMCTLEIKRKLLNAVWDLLVERKLAYT